MKFRYGWAFLGIPLTVLSTLAAADGIPDRGNEQLDALDLQLLQKYANSRINRSPAGASKPLTVSAVDPKEEGAENLSGPVAPPSSVEK